MFVGASDRPTDTTYREICVKTMRTFWALLPEARRETGPLESRDGIRRCLYLQYFTNIIINLHIIFHCLPLYALAYTIGERRYVTVVSVCSQSVTRVL